MSDNNPPPSDSPSNLAMIVWVAISVGIYSLIPDTFKYTEGPAGVLALIFAAIVAIPVTMFAWGAIKRLFDSF